MDTLKWIPQVTYRWISRSCWELTSAYVLECELMKVINHPSSKLSLTECVKNRHREVNSDGYRHIYTNCINCHPSLFASERDNNRLNIQGIYPHNVHYGDVPGSIPILSPPICFKHSRGVGRSPPFHETRKQQEAQQGLVASDCWAPQCYTTYVILTFGL